MHDVKASSSVEQLKILHVCRPYAVSGRHGFVSTWHYAHRQSVCSRGMFYPTSHFYEGCPRERTQLESQQKSLFTLVPVRRSFVSTEGWAGTVVSEGELKTAAITMKLNVKSPHYQNTYLVEHTCRSKMAKYSLASFIQIFK
jgi:hypothetical protein